MKRIDLFEDDQMMIDHLDLFEWVREREWERKREEEMGGKKSNMNGYQW